ncbi:MAG: glycosyltransferase family 1 protein [Acidimicrobiales bacterium]
MTSMRIGVNLMWCLPDHVGGSEQYLTRQLAGALEAQPDLDLTVFATPAYVERYRRTLAGAELVTSPVDGHRRWQRVAAESTWLYARTGGFDVMQHGGGTAPRRAHRPYVLTIHDLQYRTYPEYFTPLKRRYLDSMIPRSARRAAVVTVPSEYVRRSVVRELGIEGDRVVVVPHGYEPELLVERTPADELRERFALGDGRVLVYPAMSAPHKNHRFLVELLETEWRDPDLRLVLIGGRGLAAEALDAAIAAASPSTQLRIVRPGRVSDADKNGLIAMAAALVFPSTYEGFGAPLIEAMALGTPVLCSNATCLPDIAGDAAVVKPLLPSSWADGLEQVIARRDELIAAGHRRVQDFTSRRSGEALLEMYDWFEREVA